MNNTLQPARESFEKSMYLLHKKNIKEAKLKSNVEKQIEIEANRERLEYKTSITKRIFDSINNAVERGETHAHIVLNEYWSRRLTTHHFKFDDVIKDLILDLKSNGYDVYYGPNEVCHDTSDAYMNSGGECGSSTPRYSTTLDLVVDWQHPA
jgi:excinuclease UvrABC ATPase subunit